MSYAAESYPIIVDQLLTALTGGMAREAHRFLPAGNGAGYAFEMDPGKILWESVQICGQSNETFILFQQNRDFVITDDDRIQFFQDEENLWSAPEGVNWPDEGSEFYVSYYHKESYKAPLTDRNVGSLTRTLTEAYGRELAVMRKQMELVYKSGFVDTAEGLSLDRVVALVGLSRKSREYAQGKVRFYRDDPAPADIYIPSGTKVSTKVNPAAAFTTSEMRTLRRGQLAVECDVRAEVRGPQGVVASGGIAVINQSILGITGVVNDAPTLLGGEVESDAALRERAKKVMERVGKATPRAMLLTLASVKGLQENDIKITEDLQGRAGVVKVYVAQDTTANPGLAVQVQQAIFDSRPAGIRVEHNLEVTLPDTDSTGLLDTVSEGRDAEWEMVEAPVGEEFLLPIFCDALIFPSDPRLAPGKKAAVKKAVEDALLQEVDALSIGGTIVYNQLVTRIMSIPEVLDVNLVLRIESAAAPNLRRNIKLPEGRKAAIEAANLTVHFAGEVSFDFTLAVTPKADAKTADIKNEIQTRLVDYFVQAPAQITGAVLMGKLGTGNTYLLQASDLGWDAEFANAGMIIREQGGALAVTAIPAGDRAVLRSVKVEVISV